MQTLTTSLLTVCIEYDYEGNRKKSNLSNLDTFQDLYIYPFHSAQKDPRNAVLFLHGNGRARYIRLSAADSSEIVLFNNRDKVFVL